MAWQALAAGLVQRIHRLPQPVIAAVNGAAAGAGLSIALAADTRIASTAAKFNAAFVRIGLSGGDMGASYFLPRIVGLTAATEMLFTGRMVHAEEAQRIGLVLRVVEPDCLLDEAIAIGRAITRQQPLRRGDDEAGAVAQHRCAAVSTPPDGVGEPYPDPGQHHRRRR